MMMEGMMSHSRYWLIGILLLTACTSRPVTPTPEASLPNPASVHCEQNGGKLELRQDASGGVAGICIFPDGSECDEWAFFRGECQPGEASVTPESSPTPEVDIPDLATSIPTPMPIDPPDYQGWWTFTHATYGFSLMLPSDWVVDEPTTGDALMNGHLLNLHTQNGLENLNIRMTFRQVGEDFPLWPTGVGSGEFIDQGILEIAGEPARRVLFVCPSGQVNSIWYHQSEDQPNIRRGELEFGFIFSYSGVYCQEGYSLEGKVQRVGEMIIASLKVP
jgi:putative hemolysin